MDEVRSVLASGILVGGERIETFEDAFSRRMGTLGSRAVSSGTAALHLALLALAVGPGDEVVIPGYVCSAPLHAVRYTGAEPVLADVHPETGISGSEEIDRVITKKTRAVIAVHLFGRAAPMDEITSLGIPVIEDAAQAVGGVYGSRPLGSWGDASVFSFYATKVITTGHGGMVSSGSRDILSVVEDLREYDKREDDRLRYNYSMTEVAAAIGGVQLERLDEFLMRRRKIASFFREEFEKVGAMLPPTAPAGEDIHYRFIIKAPKKAAETIDRLTGLGISARRPVFSPLYSYTGSQVLPGVKRAFDEDVSIPIYPALTDTEVEKISEAVRKVLE
jgi:perosamine synthetase